MASTASFSSCPQAQTYSSTWPKPSKLSLQPPLLQAITVFLHSFPPQPQAPFRPRSLPPCLRLRPRQFRRKFDEFTVTHQRISPDYASGFTAADFYPRPAVDCRAVSEGMYKMANQELKLESKEIDRRKYNLFRWRQIKAETEAWERMVEEYKDLERVMREKKLAPNLPYVKALFLGWFEPLREAIAREQQVQQTKKHKAAFAPNIDLLPPDKMALIVMHKMMGLGMVGNQHGCVQVVQAAVHIGMAIEQEVRIHSFLEKNQKLPEKEDCCC